MLVCRKSLQVHPTLGDPMACSPPGSSMGFPRQEYWSGLSCPTSGYLPDPGIKAESLWFPALIGGFFTTNAAWEAQYIIYYCK